MDEFVEKATKQNIEATGMIHPDLIKYEMEKNKVKVEEEDKKWIQDREDELAEDPDFTLGQPNKKSLKWLHEKNPIMEELKKNGKIAGENSIHEFTEHLSEVKAIATVIGNSENKVILYKWHYPVNLIKRNRISLIFGEGNRVLSMSILLILVPNLIL